VIVPELQALATTGDVDPNGDVVDLVDLDRALLRVARLRAAVGPDYAAGFDPAEHVAAVLREVERVSGGAGR